MNVITWKNLPTGLPVIRTCVVFLMMEHFHASRLAWGIAGTVLVFDWILALTVIYHSRHHDISDLLIKYPEKKGLN
jgi:hypothetical protein